MRYHVVWASGEELTPGEGTADAEVQLLAGVHGQRLVAVGLPQLAHGLPDVRVGDGAELGSEHGLLAAVRRVHCRLDGVQDLQ